VLPALEVGHNIPSNNREYLSKKKPRVSILLVTAEVAAVQERQTAEVQEQKALVQASIGFAFQSLLELNGDKPERPIFLVLEAIENYPCTW
jgi:hypothetical protein